MVKKAKTQLVQIYERKTKGGTTFYLHYTLNGEQIRENTRLRLSGDKEADKVILKAVQMLQADRTAEILSGRTGIAQNSKRNTVLLVDYCTKVKERYKSNDTRSSNYTNFIALGKLEQVIRVATPKARICDINKRLCEDIAKEIKSEDISDNLKRKRWALFGWLLNKAVKEDLIEQNPVPKISFDVKAHAAERVYLLEEEIKSFANVETENETQQVIKDAFLFSCLSGLRYSDVSRLTAAHIETVEGGLRLKIETKKTKKYISFVLSKECEELIKSRIKKTNGGLLFPLPSVCFITKTLKTLARKSRINKNVSFHTARHTFATLLLTKGADLYSVSSLLGHSNINTTQIYAKIIDKKKDDTIKLLEGVL